MNTKEIEMRKDHLTNRILINFGVAIVGYIVLMLLWRTHLKQTAVFAVAGVLAALTVLFFILTKIKDKRFKNYAIASLVLTVGTLFLKAGVITAAVIGHENFANLIKIHFFEKLFNGRVEVIGIAVAGAVYLVIMLIYNIVKIIKTK